MTQRPVYVNVAYATQRVTGQQRYARSIVERLPAQWPRVGPPAALAVSRIGTWLWTLVGLPWRTRDGVLVSLTARAPVWHPHHVMVVHDLFAIEHPEWYSRSYHLTHGPLLRAQLRSAARLLAVSEPVAEQLRATGAAQVEVAPDAPSEVFRRADPQDETRVEQLGLTPGTYLVAVGSLEPRKNLATLARAYRLLPADVRDRLPLAVVGTGGAVFRDQTVAWPPGTRILGYVDDDQLRALYRYCAATVLVSLAEGFGLPVVEAQAAGAPRLVLSDLDVFRWVAGDAARYVDPLDAAAVAAALGEVAEADATAGPEVMVRFGWEASARAVQEAAAGVARATSPSAATAAAGATSPSAVPSPAEPEPSAGRSVAVVVASLGRPDVLAQLLETLAAQSLPHTVVLSVPDDTSLPAELPDGTLVAHALGLSAQRNAGMALVPDAEFVFTFDDDSLVRSDYLRTALGFFDTHPEVVALTGKVLLDGAQGAQIGLDRARGALAGSLEEPLTGGWRPSRELYGCNFVFRRSAAPDITFDERLPLYSWLEDHDFARRLMRRGVLAKVDDCVIVHRGVKSGGRTAHIRLGYSQVMNPAYLHRKGSFPLWLTLHETVPRCGKNVVLAAVGPEKQARQERLRGNALAIADLARGRFTPERIVSL